MNTNKSHNVTLTDEQFKLIKALESSPELTSELSTAVEQLNSETENGMDAYQAECKIVELVQKIGKSMVTDWATKTQETAVEQVIQDTKHIKPGKKNATGIAPLEESN